MSRNLSTSAVARMLGVAVRSVANWIDQGLIKAGRTPGGHRRIQAVDLVAFLRRQGLPIPAKLKTAPRILVVDDEQAVARWIGQEIRTARPDVEVREANDGFAAGELVGKWRPDMVVLDLRMPEMDGFEVCRRIMAQNDTSHIAVIAVTADTSPETAERIIGQGARICLNKPLDVAALLSAISEADRDRPESRPGETNEQTHHAIAMQTPDPVFQRLPCPA